MTTVRGLLAEHIEMIQRYKGLPLLSTRERKGLLKELNSHVLRVNHVLSTLGPDFGQVTGKFYGAHVQSIPQIERVIHLLDQLDGQEALYGSAAPALPMACLHLLVGIPALPLWEAGKYRQAVNDAATHVNDALQKRLCRHDVSDKDLMAQAFSDKDPKPGEPRLRCPGDSSSMTVRSQQQGAQLFAMGAFQAIRNPAHHLTGDWNPITALEHLAALSTIARWITGWNLLRHIPPTSEYLAIQKTIAAGASQSTKPTN